MLNFWPIIPFFCAAFNANYSFGMYQLCLKFKQLFSKRICKIEELIDSSKKHVCLSLNEFKCSEKTLSVAADFPAQVSEV